MAGFTIKDAVTNNATLTLAAPGAAGSLGNAKNIVVDTTAPTVTNITSSPATASYKAGQTVHVNVSFSEPVSITGTPTLALNTSQTANYVSGSGTANVNMGGSGLGQYALTLRFSQSSPTFSCSWHVAVAPTSG